MPAGNGNEEIAPIYKTICDAVTLEGRLAYCMMSVHAVNPLLVQNFTKFDPQNILLCGMVGGIGVMIYTRPCIKQLIPAQRISFSLLASLSFSCSSILWFQWLRDILGDQPYILTPLGYISGRIFMLHLITFLQHMDIVCVEPELRSIVANNIEILV